MITFVSGGARSGKSSYAEKLAISLFEQKRMGLFYIATAKAMDQEMKERIDRHQEQRIPLWKTIEEPYDLLNIFPRFQEDDVLLIDCLTIWLSSMLYERHEQEESIVQQVEQWIKVANQKKIHLFIVSNDLNEGFPMKNEIVQDYIRVLERLHRHICQQADQVLQVVAGLPVLWR